MTTPTIEKEHLEGRLEPFLLKKLQQPHYNLISLPAKDLLTWNRLDLAFKLFYLKNKAVLPELAESVYRNDIRSQSLGCFKEPGNEGKDTFHRYIEVFSYLFKGMSHSGFNDTISLIPLSKSGTLMNGAHRVAAAAFLDQEVTCVQLELEPLICDYLYFYRRDVSSQILDMVVNTFIEYANNTYIAFLWPSSAEYFEELESFFSNIVYKKKLSLNKNGLFNLLTQVYAKTPWLGSLEDGFKGARVKCMECSGRIDNIIVIVFQAESIEEVRSLKEKIRDVVQIGFSSVHITDTKEEAIELGKLLFNENSVHFLNFANPFKYKKAYNHLDQFKELIRKNGAEKDHVAIDGSMVLTMYGIRENLDIDCLTLENIEFQDDDDIEDHSSQLKHHKKTLNDLLLNPKHFFYFYGLKFISLTQLYAMKKTRGEKKDTRDIKLMDSYLTHDTLRFLIEGIRQKTYYLKLRTSRVFMEHAMSFLRKTGLYSPVRSVYRRLRGRGKNWESE